MKKLSIQWSFLLLAAAFTATFTSCEDDTTSALGPDVTFTTTPVDTAEESTVISFNITASAGDADLARIVVTEDGVDISADRLEFEDGTSTRAGWGANPKLLDFDEFRSGFSWTVYLTVHDEAGVTKDYNIRLTDADGEFDDLPFSVTSGLPEGPSLVFAMDVPMTGVNPSSLVSFTIETSTGDADLNSIGLTEDGVAVDVSRLEYRVNGMMPDIDWTANPESVDTDESRGGFIWQVFLRVHPEEGTTKIYSMTLTDANDQTDVYDFSITTNSSLTIETLESAQWWNFSGPNAGCIDLETGMTWLQAQSESDQCDLIDLGTDSGDQAGNWLKGFKAENGAELKFPRDGFSPTDFQSIVDEFNAGTAQGDVSAIENAWYLAKDAQDRYYAFEFIQIAETDNDSQDFYRIRILKQKM